MNYALQLSASGVLTSMYRQDVLANNLANVDTIGFKPDTAATRQRDVVTVEDGVGRLPSNRLLERLGAGVLLQPNRTGFSQGVIERTNGELDAAIEGEGFFVVAQGGGRDAERLRLTRDGRFTLDSSGKLVQASSGMTVLDSSGNPIIVRPDNGPVRIEADGRVVQKNQLVATLRYVDAADTSLLKKLGQGLYQVDSNQVSSLSQGSGRIVPKSIEHSAVDPIQAIMGVTGAAGSVANNARMIQLSDELMGRAITSLGRVA